MDLNHGSSPPDPLVSIILIFWNEEAFLPAAIASVLAQTYAHWELLLVDDGSDDRSTTIAQTYAHQFPEQIQYLDHPDHQNQGMSASRNLGIAKATGTYLTFLDGDDVWLPAKLEHQVAILTAHPDAAFVCGRTQWWYSWSHQPDAPSDFLQTLDVPLDTLVPAPTLLLLFLRDEWASLCDVLVRRAIVEAVGGYEAAFRGLYEDQAFHAKLCLQWPAYVSSHCGYRYRQHPEACCAVAHRTGQTRSARQIYLNWLEGYLKQHSIHQPQVWHLVQHQLWPYRHPLLFRISYFWHHPRQFMHDLVTRLTQQLLPAPLQARLQAQWQGLTRRPPVGWVRFGHLRRLTPISREFGFDRGLPIDRYYVERFLAAQAADIQGRVLEIGDDVYLRQFGGDRVTQPDILHVHGGNPKATFVGDLTTADHLPSAAFDCVILAQTLHLIYDVRAALTTLHRILKPGGVLLATFPGLSQKSQDEWGDAWCWGFTTRATRQIFEETFPGATLEIQANGNVLVAIAFLQGLATQELRQSELDYRDPQYETLITVRVVKPNPGGDSG